MAWELTGNAGTDPATNFLGTTDNQPLVIKANGTSILGISATVNVETSDILKLERPPVGGVKNANSAGFFVGAFEPGISGRSRLDINVAGTPGPNNSFGGIPDVPVISLFGDGNVSIGTTNPSRRLSLEGGPELALRLRDNTVPTDAFWELQPTAFQSDQFGIVRYESGVAQGSKSLVIAPNGSVGIGTTSPLPEHKLEVQATGTNTALSVFSPDGLAVGATSNTSTAVQGSSNSKDFVGVVGSNTNQGIGVLGSGFTGVKGSSTLGIGVEGQSTNGNGVVGTTSSDTAAGVLGSNNGSGPGVGVLGHSIGGVGVDGTSENGVGVSGTSGTNWCGRFQSIAPASNGVFISVPAGQPGLQVASGTKSAVVATSQGTRALHTEESTAVWFTDYGFGHLQAGRTVVTIDPLFAETVNLSESYHVFVQLNDADAEGVAVVNKTASSFEVVELRNGHSNAEFSYRLVAKRRGYEQSRLEQAPWADDDPNLYPEKRSAWEAQQRLRRPEIPQVEVPPRPPEMPR